MNFNFDRFKNLVSKISVWSKNPNNKIKLYLLIAALVVIVCLKIWLLSSFFFSNVQNNESQIFYVYDNYTLDSVTTHLKKENIISKAHNDSEVLDLNAPILRPEKVGAHKNQYDTFFED